MPYRVSHGYAGESAANTAKTHTITDESGKQIYLNSLALSLKGADSSNDIDVDVKDNGTTIWSVTMRDGGVLGGFFDFSAAPIVIANGDLTIVTGAGGADCIVKVSVAYEVS